MPGLKTKTKGPDNTIGSSRTNEGDKYAAAEILTAYFPGNLSHGFYFQESAKADGPTTYKPGISSRIYGRYLNSSLPAMEEGRSLVIT